MKFRQTRNGHWQVTIQLTLSPDNKSHRRFKRLLEKAAPREAARRILEVFDECTKSAGPDKLD